jgi:hypothetical protein
MMDYKAVLGITATALTFIAYIPYYRDILRGKTHPHIYSWSLWFLLTILIVAQQIAGGAGYAALVTLAAGLLCIGVIILSLKDGKKEITRSDTIVAALSLLAIVLWVVVSQPILSVFLAVAADIFAFIPTIRKSWSKPYSETLSLYATNSLRFGLAILAVKHYSVLSTLWLATWVVGNGAFSLMLVMRRRAVHARSYVTKS